MPSGKIHNLACIAVAGVSASATFFLSTPERAIAIGAGALSGIMISGDWDVDAGFSGDAIIRKYFGLIAEKAFDIMLYPYRKIFKHRGFLSHFPIISTVIRLLYLALWIGPIYYWLGGEFVWRSWMGWFVAGLMLSDTVHALLDWADQYLFGGRL